MKTWLISTLLFFLGHLPLKVNHAIGGFLGWCFWLFPTRDKKIAMINLSRCFPEKDAKWHRATARKSFIEAGKALTETSVLWHASGERINNLITEFFGLPVLEAAATGKQGAILASPHMGSWELTGLYAASKYPMTSLYKPPKIKALDQLIKRARETTGSHLVPTTAGGIRKLHRALNQGECIGLLPDQEPGHGRGVFAPLFNIQAYTMTLLHRLSHEKNIPVVICFAERLPRGKGYHFHILAPDERIHDDDPAVSAAALNDAIEKIIRINPSQYIWGYKRFKKRPDGSESFYS